jgi:putative transposase
MFPEKNAAKSTLSVAVFVRTRLTPPAHTQHRKWKIIELCHPHATSWLTFHNPFIILNPMSNPGLHHLPRLDRPLYQAFAVAHWNMKVEPPIVGWLNEDVHRDFRELLLHACVRQRLLCPAYCLMPDHLHLIWMGLSLQSDQLIGTRFLRKHFNRLLAGQRLDSRESAAAAAPNPPEKADWKLQPQAYDHVLREEERKRHAFASVCFYILANPVRAGLAKREQDWRFSGAVVPGYPELYPFHGDFWEVFWKIYSKHREPTPTS